MSGFVISCNLSITVVLNLFDKIIPLIIISSGILLGLMLSNYKNKNFRSILILRPVFQKVRFYSIRSEIVKMGDLGFREDLGGPGILASIKNFFFTFHPLISVSLILLVMRLF